MAFLTEKQIEEQEHLSDEFLATLQGPEVGLKPRPVQSLSELMLWVRKEFLHDAPWDDPIHSSIMINNKILIDGAFLTFCKEKGIVPQCKRKETIATWKTNHDFEHFIAQGVFHITDGKELDFFQATLMHKGNQGEDEVSYFVVVADEKMRAYIDFRNEYVEWVKKRERGTSEVEVIGGQSVIYDCDLTWDDIILPEKEKTRIITSIEGFLKSREKYKEKKVPWKRGLIFWGPRGNGKTMALKVIMSVYQDLKPVTIQGNHPSLDEVLEDAFSYAHDHAPSLLFIEDIEEVLKSVKVSFFLQLLDGFQTKEGSLVIATGNDLRYIEENLTNRPRRFDRIIEFPLPTEERARAYFKMWFADIVTDEDYNLMASKAVKNGFTYAHLQEVYVLSVFYAVQDDREDPKREDVLSALEEAIEGKALADRGFEAPRRSITEYGNDYRP